jgi:hypothetical protein
MVGCPTLFIRADEMGRSWRIVDPVLRHWAGDPSPIPLYQAATWGPPEAAALIACDGRRWRSLSRPSYRRTAVECGQAVTPPWRSALQPVGMQALWRPSHRPAG